MMEQRQIKFRAWIELDKYMFYQNNQYLGSFLRRANTLFNPSHSGHDSYGVPPLMQYTGLKDCNGKEIYEGDIIYVAGIGNCEVIFLFAAWAFENESHLGLFNECEEELIIIGNIYENPELLNK